MEKIIVDRTKNSAHYMHVKKNQKDDRIQAHRHTITIDDRVWDEAGPILEKIGYSYSQFLEMQLRAVLNHAGALNDVIEAHWNIVTKGAIKKK